MQEVVLRYRIFVIELSCGCFVVVIVVVVDVNFFPRGFVSFWAGPLLICIRKM